MTGLAVDLLDLGLAGVLSVVAFNFGGIHLESLSHLLLFLAALADLGEDGLGDFGDFTHLEVSGRGWDGPDGHCHDADVVVVGPVGLGVGVGAGVEVGVVGVVAVVVISLLGFMTTLLGQDKFGGLLALYFGVVSEELLEVALL